MAKVNVYELVTNRILAKLEEGVVPWQPGWINYASDSSLECAVSYQTGKPYSLLNQMLLGAPGEYVTYKEAQKRGGHVKKGAKGLPVVFWKMIACRGGNSEEGEEDTESDSKGRTVPVLKYYTVFPLTACEGLEPKYAREPTEPVHGVQPDETAEFVANSYLEAEGISLRHQGSSAFYTIGTDTITIPAPEMFISTGEYYSTLFHEMTHSTGVKKRLDRPHNGRFGSEKYSREELIAEIGAAALVARCGLETSDTFSNSAAYIDNWMQVLKKDDHAIVVASGKAQKAVERILSYSLGAEAEEADEEKGEAA